jgi:outer membrane autotransporter protein
MLTPVFSNQWNPELTRMKRTFSIGAALLICSAAAMAQYTNVLDGGTTQTVDSVWTTNTIQVGDTTPDNALNIVSGGVVTSTNAFVGTTAGASNNLVSVTGSGSWTIEDTLEIGVGTSNSVSVGGRGTLSVGNLVIYSGNELNLNSGGTFAIANDFSASSNGFTWGESSALSVGGNLTGMAVTDNAVRLGGGRDLTLDGGIWDISGTNLVVGYDGSLSELLVKNTGTLSSANTYIGWDTNSANSAITVRDGSTWNNSGDLWVGYGADGAVLSIFNAGTSTISGNAYIGNTNTANNQVRVTGTNSLWDIEGNLVIGTGSNSVNHSLEVSDAAEVVVGVDLMLNAGNSLSLDSGGSIEVGGNMNIYSNTSLAGSGTILFGANDSELVFNGPGIGISPDLVFDGGLVGDNTVSVNDGSFTISGSSDLQYTNFQALVLNNSTLDGFGTVDAFNSIDMTRGMIDPAGDDTGLLEIGGTFTAASGTVYRAQVYETQRDELVFTGTDPVDLENMEAEVLVVSAPLGAVTIMRAPNLTNTFSKTTIEDRLLLFTAVLQVTTNEVQISLEADPLESSMEFASTEMIRAGFSGMKNAVFTRTKQLRRNLVATLHAVPNEAYLLTNTNAPAGAMGPGDQDTIFDMHVWIQQQSGQGDFDRQGLADGFTLNNQGTTIGADRLIGEALTLGLNYTYARSSARTTGSDDLDSETYWLGAYGEWVGEEGLYVDAMVAYGSSDYDTDRREENYRGTASYDGQAVGAYADVGQYYYHGGLALSPYAGIHVLSIQVDSHDETDELGSSVDVDEVTRNIVESAIGLKMRHRFDTQIGRFQTTGFAEWAHDFIEDDVSATLTAQGFPSVGTGSITPDADTFNVGLGYSWITTEYLEVGIGYNGRFSDDYEEHAGSLMLDIMF